MTDYWDDHSDLPNSIPVPPSPPRPPTVDPMVQILAAAMLLLIVVPVAFIGGSILWEIIRGF